MMFGMSGIKLGLLVFGGLAIITVISLVFNRYTNLIDTVIMLEKNNTTLTTAVDLQKTNLKEHGEAIDEWEESQGDLVNNIAELSKVSIEASKERRRLNDIFSRHDFTNLARKNPGLIERRINRGTAAALRMLECSSGATHSYCSNKDQASRHPAELAEPTTR